MSESNADASSDDSGGKGREFYKSNAPSPTIALNAIKSGSSKETYITSDQESDLGVVPKLEVDVSNNVFKNSLATSSKSSALKLPAPTAPTPKLASSPAAATGAVVPPLANHEVTRAQQRTADAAAATQAAAASAVVASPAIQADNVENQEAEAVPAGQVDVCEAKEAEVCGETLEQNPTLQEAATADGGAGKLVKALSFSTPSNIQAVVADAGMDFDMAGPSAARTTLTTRPTQLEAGLLLATVRNNKSVMTRELRPKVDHLSSCPAGVLHGIFFIASGRRFDGGLLECSNSLLEQFAPPLAAARCCSKLLRDVCNSVSNSLFLKLTDLEKAEPYILKLDRLSRVSVSLPLSATETSILSMLKFLQGLQKDLTYLALEQNTRSPNKKLLKIQASIKNQVLQFKTTLQCLVMHGLDVSSWEHFLSEFLSLRAIELRDMSPCFSPKHLLVCTHLVELNVKGAGCIEENSLDLSFCPFLRIVSCQSCTLTDLNVSCCTDLVTLYCSNNGLEVLNLLGCPDLKHLKCANNKLSVLELTKNTALEVLDCSTNPLWGLTLSRCPSLEKLTCIDCNTFHDLSLTHCNRIIHLQTNFKNIAGRELEACLSLSILNISHNSAHTFVFLRTASLECLTCIHISHSSIGNLILTSRNALKTVELHDNTKMKALIVTNCVSLQTVSARNCSLRYMDVSGNPALETLTCINCPIGSLDFSKPNSCDSLREVCFECTNLSDLDLSHAAATLQTLVCRKARQLKALCVSGCSNLSAIDCSECLVLEELKCGGCSNLQFEPLHFKNSAYFHFMEFEKLLGVGGLDILQTGSVYMDKRKIRVGISIKWPANRDKDGN